MKWTRSRLSPVCLVVTAAALGGLSLAGQAVHPGKVPGRVTSIETPVPMLPQSFAGFELQGKLVKTATPAGADPGNGQVLEEYGFRDFASGTYKSDVNTVTIHAMRFADVSGAYGAYTFYRVPGMHPEDIGKGGASDGKRVIFWNGATVVDADFDHLTAMSAASLRELAQRLPVVGGAAGVLPSLPGFLPRTDLEPTRTRYSLGPEAYVRSGGVLPPSLVNFGKSPEVLSGVYSLQSGEGMLTVIEYPTPQIAVLQERAIAAYLKAGPKAQPPFSATLEASNTQALVTRRSGLLVAISSGGFDATDAHRLVDRVNYEASVTWNNPAGYVPETTKAARLLVGVVTFCLITCGATLLLGIFMGGGRALYRKARGKPASSVDEMEFIKLNLQ